MFLFSKYLALLFIAKSCLKSPKSKTYAQNMYALPAIIIF